MTSRVPHLPDNICLYAIGDIHGQLNRLEQLVKIVRQDARAHHPDHYKQLIFLGDYIDRGPESRGVIDFLLNGLPIGFEAIFLRGNHEDILLRVLGGDIDIMPAWLQYGGTATLASYGVNPFRPRVMEKPKQLKAELAQQLPLDHRQFLEKTLYSYMYEDYFFAHAGVRPDIPLDRQQPEDLLWIRHDFLSNRRDFGKFVIHGHTISIEPDIQSNRIGIDTGAYATGRLSCVKLIGDERHFFTT